MRTNSMRFMQACRDALFVLDGPIVIGVHSFAATKGVEHDNKATFGQCLAATEGVELIHQLS